MGGEYFRLYGDGEDGDVGDEGGEGKREREGVGGGDDDNSTRVEKRDRGGGVGPPPLLGRDEILQIKIVHASDAARFCPPGSVGQCSRVREVVYPRPVGKNGTDDDDDGGSGGEDDGDDDNDPSLRRRGLGVVGGDGGSRGGDGGEDRTADWRDRERRRRNMDIADAGADAGAAADRDDDRDPDRAAVDPLSSPSYWSTPHYLFSTNEALLRLSPRFRLLHNVTVINVTLTERCLSSGHDYHVDDALASASSFLTPLAETLNRIVGPDAAVINQLMYGIRTAAGYDGDGEGGGGRRV